MAHWDEIVGSELYDHGLEDSVENSADAVNLVARLEWANVVASLRAGWRVSPVGVPPA